MAAFIFVGCDENAGTPTAELYPREYIPGRGDDGRELVYEWTDPDTGEKLSITAVSVSPDGMYAAFGLGNKEVGSNIAKINLNTKERDVILGEEYSVKPDWSYDGQWIAFHHDGAGFFDISVIRPDGTGRRVVISDPSSDTGPLWFHRSNKFVYQKYYLFEGTEEAAIYDLNTGEKFTVTDPNDKWNVYPWAVSPDDEWIAAMVWENKLIDDPWCDPDPEEVIGTWLAIIRADGSECIWIVGDDEMKGDFFPEDWSPDGRYILCAWRCEALGYMDRELWKYDMETGVLEQITMAPPDFPPEDSYYDYEEIRSADWASDEYIYFTNNLGLLYRIKAPIGSCKPVDDG